MKSKNLLKRILSPFGKGSFWVIGLAGCLLWLLIFWLAYKIGLIIYYNRETVAGVFLGSFGFSYVAQLIFFKNEK